MTILCKNGFEEASLCNRLICPFGEGVCVACFGDTSFSYYNTNCEEVLVVPVKVNQGFNSSLTV
jgi:hypothetical protein